MLVVVGRWSLFRGDGRQLKFDCMLLQLIFRLKQMTDSEFSKDVDYLYNFQFVQYNKYNNNLKNDKHELKLPDVKKYRCAAKRPTNHLFCIRSSLKKKNICSRFR